MATPEFEGVGRIRAAVQAGDDHVRVGHQDGFDIYRCGFQIQIGEQVAGTAASQHFVEYVAPAQGIQRLA